MYRALLLATAAQAVNLSSEQEEWRGALFDPQSETPIPYKIVHYNCDSDPNIPCSESYTNVDDEMKEGARDGLNAINVVFDKPVEKLTGMLGTDLSNNAAGLLNAGLSKVEEGSARLDELAEWDGKVAHAVKNMTTELKDDLWNKGLPKAQALEGAIRSFMGNVTDDIDSHAEQTGADFRENVLPIWEKATTETIDDLTTTVMPKLNALTKSVVAWEHATAKRGKDNLWTPTKDFGSRTASNWMSKVQPVIEKWMTENAEEAAVFHNIETQIAAFWESAHNKDRLSACNNDPCCALAYPPCPTRTLKEGEWDNFWWCWHDDDQSTIPEPYESCNCESWMCPADWPQYYGYTPTTF